MTKDIDGDGWLVPAELSGKRLDAALRALSGKSWAAVRRLLESGKVRVDDRMPPDGGEAVVAGSHIRLNMRAPDPRKARRDLAIVHVDAAVVVVNKPAGVSTIPYGDEPPDAQRRTLDALVRTALSRRTGGRGRPPLGVVQRLDKETSGLIVFARTLAAKRHIGQQLRLHSVERRYLAIAHGHVAARTIRSRLVKERGDGIRGSTANPRLGQLAITHVEPIEHMREATLVSCRLETGRTHQIRIHLSEAGHPLVGESVYIRDHEETEIRAPRLMLHAIELGFEHPTSGRRLFFRCDPPEDFQRVLARLRGTRAGSGA